MNRAERRRLAKQRINPASSNNAGGVDRLFQAALDHQQHGRLVNAARDYQAVIHSRPDFADAHYNLGIVQMELEQLDDAIASFQRTIKVNPEFAGAYFNLGFVLSETGALEQAKTAFRAVIKLIPDAADAHRQLASITKHVSGNTDISAMESLYAKSGITEAQRMDVSFGLAKANEDLGKYSTSFEYLAEGNRLKRKTYSYSTDEQKLYFSRFQKTFSTTLLNKPGIQACSGEAPIFILGMPRSGTSLVEQILASHPGVYGGGELTTLSQAANATFGAVADSDYSERVLAATQNHFTQIGTSYAKSLPQMPDGIDIITDKMPHNFLHIGLIKLALPNAKIIHCKRDPMDTCLSIYKTYFPGTVHEYSSDLTELGEYYTLYSDLMDHWHNVLPGYIYDIQYEQLVADQEHQSRALIAACGLDWDDACLEFYKSNRAVKTASMAQVRSPIYNSSVQLWKRYEKELAPLIAALGRQSRE